MRHDTRRHARTPIPLVFVLAAMVALPSAVLGSVAGPAGPPHQEQETVRVVTTLPTYAAIAREITGDLARVEAIARGDEDPHFVTPRPSFARAISRADLFVTTGLDLEVWVPGLLDRANNPRVLEGAPGHVVAYSGVRLLDVPETTSRAEGDIHIYGNPHVHTDPVNAVQIARNILEGLRRVDPDNAAGYERRTRDFEDRILARTFGDRMIDLLGRESLLELALNGRFWSFVEGREIDGRPLVDQLGGWLAEAAPFRGRSLACYHKNWSYFSHRFRIPCAIYVEEKPGVPPTPGQVGRVITFLRDQELPVLLAANYFSRGQVNRVTERTGGIAVIVPEHVGGAEGVDTYFDLVDLWVSRLAEAYSGSGGPR